jgi:tetratricopeptide (TPR) repeat protein
MGSRLDKAWVSFLLVGVVALGVQVYQVSSLRTDPSVNGPIIDALVYHREAEHIVRGQPAPRAPHWQSPLFPWLLSATYRVTGVAPARGLVLQAALAVLIALLVLGVARFLLPPRWALAAGLVACAYGPLLFFCGQLIPAPLDAALGLAALWLALYLGPGAARPAQVALGLVFGLAVAARGNVAPFFLWLVLREARALGWRTVLARGAALSLGVVLGLAPVACTNLGRTGELSLTTSNLGVNLYVGNNPDIKATTGIRPGHAWDRLLAQPAREGARTPLAQSRYFERTVRRWALAHPGQAAKAFVIKSLDLLNGFETPRNLDPYGQLGHTPLGSVLMWPRGLRFPFGLVLPLAVLAFFALWRSADERRRAALRDVFWFGALNFIGIALFFPTARYRLGPALALIPVALLGLERIHHWIAARERPPLVPVLAAVVALLWTNLGPPLTGPNLKNEEGLQRGWAYQSQGDNPKALEVLARAAELRPDDPDVWRALGETRDKMGDGDGAIRDLQRAVALAPDFAHALQHLGAIFNEKGRFAEARDVLERCVAANPGHPLAWADLAQAYLGLRDPRRAAQAAEQGTDSVADPGTSWLLLGMARRKAGDLAGAEQALRKAVELLPDSARARYHLARCLVDQGRRDEALPLLRHAAEKWPNFRATRNLLRQLEGTPPR